VRAGSGEPVRSLAAAGPGSGAVGVFWARVSDVEPVPPGMIDAAERGRWAAYRRAVDRQRFLLGVLLTRLVVAELVGCRPEAVALDRRCETCGGAHGPVRLTDGSGWELSVTHGGDWVGLAVAGDPVGIDVEPAAAGADVEQVVADLLTPAELHALDHGPPECRAVWLLRYWTRKEATLKAARVGVTTPFTELVVTAPDEPAGVLVRPPGWEARPPARLVDLEGPPGHVASLAVLTPVSLRVDEADATSFVLGLLAEGAGGG
jgi:4'-phosphopantetheinyl transferase